jgi:uncharacterized protein with PIN domain
MPEVPAWSHVDLTAATGAPTAKSIPAAYAFEGEKRQHVFFRGDDDHLHELAISIGDHAWGHYDLTAATGAPLMAGKPCGYAFEAEKRQHVVYKGADNHIHELAISIGNNAWGHYDLTAGTGAPEAYSDPFGYAFEAEKRQHVVFKGSDLHLHELGISIGDHAWGHFDLTAGTDAPELNASLSGYAFEAEKRQHVFYTGTDDHIHELAISIGDHAWGHYDLTAGTGAPLARSKGLVCGYPFETEQRQHLLYFSRGDNHLHELASSIGDHAWGDHDLTLATSAPPPAPFNAVTAVLPAGYAFEAEKRQHVVYTDGDNHIQELAFSIGDHAWNHYDLTAATGAPPPLIGLVGYAFEAERRQHLVYMGADRHIHELAISMP